MQIVSSPHSEIPLTSLPRGKSGVIARFESTELEIALLRMGVGRGNLVQLCDMAPLGDPISLRANGTKIAIRKKDAALIWIFQPQSLPA